MENNSNADIQIKAGTVLRNSEGIFRVLHMDAQNVILIQLEIEKLNIVRVSMSFFQYEISCGEFVPTEWQEEKIPVERLREEDEEELARREKLMERMLQNMYPCWELLQRKTSKPEIDELIKELGRSKAVVYKLIRRYLQSGRARNALLDLRKGSKNRENGYEWGTPLRGYGDSNVQNDEKLQMVFEEGYIFFEKNKEKGVSLMAAYRHIVAKYYMVTAFEDGALVTKCLEENEIPTYKRFWNFCRQKNPESISKLKVSARERRNNERLLRGNSQSGCLGPGHIVEVDEVEIDMINVSSEDNRQAIGRAVMYLAVDVYSCCIVGCWVDYANNSFVGITNLLMGFLEDPVERYGRYGITITKPQELCPSGFLPMELRTDQGAEYTSSDMRRIGREIGMNISLVAPGTGSLKGLVEQAFHQFQEILKGAAAGKGVIMKSHGSRHYATACTDIEDMRKMAYEFVVYYNQHCRDYPLTREMIEAEIPPVPAKIWQYGCTHVMSPRWITDSTRDRFIFSLLKEDRKFKLSRRGITYKGLFFELSEDWFLDMMRQTGNRKENLAGVRYDPRSVNNVYMMRNGELKKIPLSEIREEQKTFQGMNWKEYDALWDKKKEIDKGLKGKDLEVAALTMRQMNDVIETAKNMQNAGKNRKKDLREAMKREKAAIMAGNTVEERMNLDEKPEQIPMDFFSKEQDDTVKKKAVIEMLDDDDFGGMDDSFGI